MDEIIGGLRAAVDSNSLYAALALALAVPDICARIETPEVRSGTRYARWWNENAVGRYSYTGWESGPHIFLSGDDVYALRCALLHEGQADITEQRVRRVLERFVFTEDTRVHCNQVDKVLQLSVSTFCRDIADAATAWVAGRGENGLPSEPQAVISIVPSGTSFQPGVVHFTAR